MQMYYVIEETMRHQQREIERRAARHASWYGARPLQSRQRLSARMASALRSLQPARRNVSCARAAALARCA